VVEEEAQFWPAVIDVRVYYTTEGDSDVSAALYVLRLIIH
jgi:hypothetical protein